MPALSITDVAGILCGSAVLVEAHPPKYCRM